MVPVSLIAAGVLAVTALGAGLFGYTQGAKSVRAELDAYRAATAMAQEQLRADALARERTLQANANRLRKEMTNEKNRLAAVQRELVDGLSDRADRPGDGSVSTTAGAAVGCTGAELARPDAEFLVGYAADAARLQLDLKACKAAYDAARDAQIGGR